MEENENIQNVFERAKIIVREFGRNCINSGDLFLAIFIKSNIARFLLEEAGINVFLLKKKIKIIYKDSNKRKWGEYKFSSSVQRILTSAQISELGLLLSIIQDKENSTVQLLLPAFNVNINDLEINILEVIENDKFTDRIQDILDIKFFELSDYVRVSTEMKNLLIEELHFNTKFIDIIQKFVWDYDRTQTINLSNFLVIILQEKYSFSSQLLQKYGIFERKIKETNAFYNSFDTPKDFEDILKQTILLGTERQTEIRIEHLLYVLLCNFDISLIRVLTALGVDISNLRLEFARYISKNIK